jgi:hypothetical protein
VSWDETFTVASAIAMRRVFDFSVIFTILLLLIYFPLILVAVHDFFSKNGGFGFDFFHHVSSSVHRH